MFSLKIDLSNKWRMVGLRALTEYCEIIFFFVRKPFFPFELRKNLPLKML